MSQEPADTSSLSQHHAVYENSSSLKCTSCGKSFKTEIELKSHKYVMHKVDPVRCDICNKIFQNPGKLTRHRWSSHNRGLFQCGIPNCLFVGYDSQKTEIHENRDSHPKGLAKHDAHKSHIFAERSPPSSVNIEEIAWNGIEPHEDDESPVMYARECEKEMEQSNDIDLWAWINKWVNSFFFANRGWQFSIHNSIIVLLAWNLFSKRETSWLLRMWIQFETENSHLIPNSVT